MRELLSSVELQIVYYTAIYNLTTMFNYIVLVVARDKNKGKNNSINQHTGRPIMPLVFRDTNASI